MTLKLIRPMFWHSWCWLLRMDLFQPSFVFLELRLILTRSASCLFCLTHIDSNSPARSRRDLSFKLPSLALIELVFFCLLIFHTFTCTDMFWWQCDMMYGAVSLWKSVVWLAETVRAMTHVINQGMAMYWGTSRWSPMEIMVSHSLLTLRCLHPCNQHLLFLKNSWWI